MKTYFDLSPRERLALTSEEITAKFIPYEAAATGVLIPKLPDLEDVPPAPEGEYPQSKPYFTVKGFPDAGPYNAHDFGILFEYMEEAEKFIQLNPISKDCKYVDDNYCNFAVRFLRYEIQVVNTFNLAALNAYTDLRKDHDGAEKRNAEKQDKYNRAVSAIETATKAVWQDWNKLHSIHNELESIITTLKEFVKVTEGNVNMAIKFMRKTTDNQVIFDALNEIDHDLNWEIADAFEGICGLVSDNNPYRSIDKPLF